MIEKIEINGLFNRLKIEVFENKILVFKKTILKYIEYEVSYEHIDTKKKVKKEFNQGVMVLALFSFCMGVIFLMSQNIEALILMLLISSILFVIGILTQKKYVLINTFSEGSIEFKFNNKNEEEVREFADTIIKTANNYLIEKYSKVDKDLPIEKQIENLYFLKNKELIDDKKFEELKNILIGRKSDEKTIGFN